MKCNIRKPNREEKKLKAEALKQATKARANLLLRQPFIGILAMRMNLVAIVDNRLSTASTDGESIYLAAKYFLSLNVKQRVYILAHEIWHCVLLHFLRRAKRERKRFNYATDLEVDFMLKEQGLEVVDLLPHDESWIGLSAESIYEKLSSQNSRKGKRKDKHIYIGDSLDPAANSGEIPAESKTKNKSKSFPTIVIDGDYKPAINSNVARDWRRRVISTSQQIERKQGTLPGSIKRMIKDLYKPELDWRQILQQFVTHCFGGTRQWLPPNRRFITRNLYLPSRRDEHLSVVIAIDTSASVTEDLPDFLAELKAIVSSFGRFDVTFIECDADIQRVREFTELEPFAEEEFEIEGYGGTNFRPVFDYIRDNIAQPKLLIYFTDGYGEAPDNPPPYPVLWVLTRDGELVNLDWGWKASLKQKNNSYI